MIKKITFPPNRPCERSEANSCAEFKMSSLRFFTNKFFSLKNLARTGFAFSILFLLSFTYYKPKKFIPPGTVQISESFFADECEISNMAWQEYEWSTARKFGKNSAEFAAALPDTLVWREKNSYNEPYVQHYYRHPAYRDYPVVGISYEQAIAFCKWRTEKVKQFCMIGKIKFPEFEYKLPTKEEWEMLADVGTHFLNNRGLTSKGLPAFNHCWMSDSIYAKYKNENKLSADVTAPVFSYWKNQFGIYNLFGNVAEMISEKGICKGGGWRHQFEECRPGKNITYEKPTSWLGFRCVCVVKLKAMP